MRKGTGVLGVAGIGLALGLATGCDLLQGLQPATLIETGGGGQGGSGGTGASGATTSAGGTSTATSCEPGTSIDCYTGPEGTQGVAMCKGGKRACKADGSGYEDACEGEVVPAAETCASKEDEDCDKLDCARWARVYGDAAAQKPLGIATDASGNVYVLGAFKGALPVVNPALVSAGQNDLFLLKLDPAGNVIWARQYGDAMDQATANMAVDAAGNVAIACPFDGMVDFGKGSLGPGGTAIVKVGPDGSTLWSRHFPSKLLGQVVLNKGADVIYWTSFSGKIDFGTGEFDAVLLWDVALAKLSGIDGETEWAHQYGYSGQYETAGGVAVDGGDNIVVCGSYDTKIDLGGGDLTKTNSEYLELFVARFDKNGALAASGTYPNAEGSTIMELDSLGSAFFTSSYEVAQGAYASDLKKVDNMVVEQWTKGFSSPSSILLESIAVDSSDAVVLAFTSDASYDFGGGELPPIGTMDLLLAKLDSGGNHLWSRRFGAMGSDQAAPVVATAPNGDILLAAQVSGTIDVGTGPIPTKGQDLLIARFAP